MTYALTTTTDLMATAHAWAADPDAWPLAARWDPSRRWYHRLARTDDHEVWLLTWLAGQGTDLHDHGGSAGAFVVAAGALVEHTVTGPDDRIRLSARTHPAGTGRRFGPHHRHRLSHTGDRPAVSLHVYSPALTTMTRYTVADGRLRVAAIDRAGAQW